MAWCAVWSPRSRPTPQSPPGRWGDHPDAGPGIRATVFFRAQPTGMGRHQRSTPIMANFFRDDSFTSDHTANLLNKGLIDGGVDQSDNSSTAVGSGAVSASGASAVNVASG